MKKFLPIMVVGFLVISGLGVAGIPFEKTDNVLLVETSNAETMIFSSLVIDDGDRDYISVSLSDTSSYLTKPGEPMLPKVVKTFELPFGAKNVKVNVVTKDVEEYDVAGEIRPASTPVPLTVDGDVGVFKSKKNEKIYASSEPFPSTSFSYRVSCGLNAGNKHVTHVSVHIYPVSYVPVLAKMYVAGSADISINYDAPGEDVFPSVCSYNMVVIAPNVFEKGLQRLINHKNGVGVQTFFKSTEEIYDEFEGVDKPEQIKYFIKYAMEEWGITYVLLVGGLKSQIWAKPRDGPNHGSSGWYVPVRYTNCFDNPEHPLSSGSIHDPGVISDLYYADIYDGEGNFSTWDTNDDGYFAAWGYPDPSVKNDTDIDFDPDLAIGRLACRNKYEVKTVVDKIINYESSDHSEKDWFKKSVSISGDGFLDQEALDIQWDTEGLPNGEYTICAQSRRPDDLVAGPVDKIYVTIDKTVGSTISFNHDDHLQVDSYPALPISEITSPSNGDVLGNTDYYYEPRGEAYCNDFNGWANIEYTDGVMSIVGKSYDPRPYGNVTDIHIWVENEDGDTVFSDWNYGLEMYYEGEWITGNKLLMGGGGALYYMPEDFEKEIIWASNGKLTGPQEIIDVLSEGCGFAFLSGHGSPNVWTDHFPGVPGNRGHGSIPSIKVINWMYRFPFIEFPLFPMSKISNKDKLPVIVIGGCHNSQFNVSMIPGLLDMKNKRSLWTHGTPVPECFSWHLVKLPKCGAIATIGNTGLGYGTLGKTCNIDGLDGGICIEFFKQYGTEGQHVLGDAYTQTIKTYVTQYDMDLQDHAKTLQQWALLGDPSLMLGGYE
jgi:hypothetical protein